MLRRQPNNHNIRREAHELFRRGLEVYPRIAERVTSVKTIEEAYDIFENMILAPSKKITGDKVKLFKTFWNDSMDRLEKQRRQLYQSTLVEDTAEA